MLEYLLVLFEYFKTCNKSYFLGNLIFSLIISVLVFLVSKHPLFGANGQTLINNSSSILGILIGFSISMFTLLNTASSESIQEIKKIEIGKKLYNKPVYLFDFLLISMIYIIVFESLLLIFNLLFPFFFTLSNRSGIIAFCLDIFLIVHIIQVNINTTIDFYFIITKKDDLTF